MAFGRIEHRHAQAPFSEINVTPLVDVMLVLLVIFIITAPLMSSAIRLDLPKAEGSVSPDAPAFITLAIDKAGVTYVNDQQIALPELATRLLQTAKANPETEIQLRADTAVPYGKVVEVMDLAQKAGLNRIGFVAQP
jgi:biopolymer transport protein TolR